MRKIVVLLAFHCACFAHADVVETFDNGSNNGDWRLTSNADRLRQIETSGGNPGAYLHGQVESAVPTWYVPSGTSTDFLGDYYAKAVVGVGADINIFVGNQEPSRTLTLDLRTTQGTGDFFMNGIEAYYVGPDISNNTPGWVSYDFSLDARSAMVPAGWTVLRGNGLPGTFLDWQALMHDVETFAFMLGQPGFAYTNHTLWDIGLDNPRLITAPVPEPTTATEVVIGMALVMLLGRIAKRGVLDKRSGTMPVSILRQSPSRSRFR
jgi:hypothetical protein